MVPNSLTRIRTFFRPRKEPASHPEALQERHLTLPRRIDDPASAASTARALLLNRREDVTLVLCMDDRHRFVGHAVVAVGWVQASRLSARPVVMGATACQATGCVLVRYGRYRALHATEAEVAFRAIADAAARHGLAVVDHLVMVPSGEGSAFLGM
ncbi:RadC-like JAB domain-containing protein [Ferrithrix thermotolerans DSM 19514]|uniref:RadC-like JAB domain-containing protein n=2 Tax=Ferrithrix TaxID=643949 RepID=A0A1M4SYS0_9ACTN|nr:RadC-like JAB domain-containing protein [Ferrithrix thermotolerans DSM 19514]